MHYLWLILARILTSSPRLVDWLIRRAQRTPYTHITSANGDDVYMGRWWLFNPYGRDAKGEQGPARFAWLPSVRIHHIRRPDQDRDLHDHPWNARTIVLRGWYREERISDGLTAADLRAQAAAGVAAIFQRTTFHRTMGYTGRLLFGQYHRINEVSPGGVWTLFITWKKRGTWGFLVDGKKVPWRQYLSQQEVAK